MSDRDGFDEFVAARYAALLRTAYLLTGHQQDAEDLVQVSLARCVPVWHRIADRPEPYVRKVLVRENVTRWRRRRWREVQVEHLPEVPVDEGWRSVDRLTLGRALADLPPRQRAAVVLRHYEGLSERETAEVMGCSVGAVKSQTHAGLARLRAAVGNASEYGDACAPAVQGASSDS